MNDVKVPEEVFVNQYPAYIAKMAHFSLQDTRRAKGEDPEVKTLRYVLSDDPEEAEAQEEVILGL